jgi:hypothetical protein
MPETCIAPKRGSQVFAATVVGAHDALGATCSVYAG